MSLEEALASQAAASAAASKGISSPGTSKGRTRSGAGGGAAAAAANATVTLAPSVMEASLDRMFEGAVICVQCLRGSFDLFSRCQLLELFRTAECSARCPLSRLSALPVKHTHPSPRHAATPTPQTCTPAATTSPR